ncbi:hypothetical protein PC115_g17236 [Phytophthora cactorum]|uniref:Uncharacterized protein n=1 Tax=Phytophthora cactorum TaxID=29920 RepID=A0A8T1B651_9STRA|nr:hypothetical protein PC115_g17236 [Phytophthora cactorum]
MILRGRNQYWPGFADHEPGVEVTVSPIERQTLKNDEVLRNYRRWRRKDANSVGTATEGSDSKSNNTFTVEGIYW